MLPAAILSLCLGWLPQDESADHGRGRIIVVNLIKTDILKQRLSAADNHLEICMLGRVEEPDVVKTFTAILSKIGTNGVGIASPNNRRRSGIPDITQDKLLDLTALRRGRGVLLQSSPLRADTQWLVSV